MIGAPDQGKQSMMINPHNANGGKANQKSQEHTPLRENCSEQPLLTGFDLQFKYEQRNSDCKHTIAEGLYTPGLFCIFHRSLYPKLADYSKNVSIGGCKFMRLPLLYDCNTGKSSNMLLALV